MWTNLLRMSAVLFAGLLLLPGCDRPQVTKNLEKTAPVTPAAASEEKGGTSVADKVSKTDEEWRRVLTPEQYRILREKGTEAPFSGEYNDYKGKGAFRCAACGAVLFEGDMKFESHCGWPAFSAPASKDNVQTAADTSHGMVRTEVLCGKCGSHLGHVFDDGPEPTGLRYCINSAALKLAENKPESK